VFTSKGGKKAQKKNWEAKIRIAKRIAKVKNRGTDPGGTSLSGIFRTTSPKL